MPSTDLRSRLDALAGAPVDPASALDRVVRRHRRRRARQAVGGVAVALAVVAGVAVARQPDEASVDIVDTPPTTTVELAVFGTDRRLPAAGDIAPAWRERLAIPYGDASSELGDGQFGPEYAAPAPDGSWWVLDTNKSRVARFGATGGYLDSIPYPPGGGSYQVPFMLSDRLVASRDAGATLLLADDTGARLLDAGEEPRSWSYSDRGSLFSSNDEAITVVRGSVTARQVDWWLTPLGSRFRVSADAGHVDVALPDLGHRVRINVSVPPDAPLGVEVAADTLGVIHLLVYADVDGVQRAGYLRVQRSGEISSFDSVRDPFGGKDPGSPAHLRVIPGTETVALTYVDDDALRIYTRDVGCEGRVGLVGDLDGDGADDEVYHEWVGDQAELGVCTADRVVRQAAGLGQSEELQLIDIGDDGRPEILYGTTTMSYRVVQIGALQPGRLGPVTLEGAPLQLRDGVLEHDDVGNPTLVAAFGCVGDDVVEVRIAADGPRLVLDRYGIDGAVASRVSHLESVPDLDHTVSLHGAARALVAPCTVVAER